MTCKANKISTGWIRETRDNFRAFLDETDFPDSERLGKRSPKFRYPEWSIMFIAILSVKLKIKSYVQIHKMAIQYWGAIAEGLDLEPISEKQLRDRFKKIRHFPGKPVCLRRIYFSTIS